MEAKSLRLSSSSQRQVRPFQTYSRATLQAGAVDAPASSRQGLTPDPQHRWSAGVPLSCGSRGGGCSGGSSRCSGTSWRRCCDSTHSQKSLHLAPKHSRSAAWNAVYPTLMARRHVFLVICFLLSAGVTFLQQLRLTQGAEVITFQPGEDLSKDDGSSGREGIAVHTGKGNVLGRSKSSNREDATDSEVETANTSTNGGGGSRPVVAEESQTDGNTGGPAVRRPLRTTSSTRDTAAETAEDTGSSSAPGSLEASNSSSRPTEEDITAEGPINSRTGLWIPTAAEEETSIGHNGETNEELNAGANLAENADEEFEDVYEIAVGGQPLATEESKDAISFSGVGEDSTEPPSTSDYETNVRRRTLSSPLPSTFSLESPELYFTAKESLFANLYKEAKRQMQEEEQTNEQQQQRPPQKQHEHQHSRQDALQQPVPLPHTGGNSAFSFNEGAPPNLQTSAIPIFSPVTLKGAAKRRSNAGSLTETGQDSTLDSAAAALSQDLAADTQQIGTGVFEKYAAYSALADEMEKDAAKRVSRHPSAPAASLLTRRKREEDAVEAADSSTTTPAHGRPETPGFSSTRLTAATATPRRRQRPLTFVLQYDNPGPNGKGMRRSWRRRTSDRFPSQAPAAGGVNHGKTPTGERGQQGAAEKRVPHEQQQHKEGEGEASKSTPEYSGASSQARRVSTQGEKAEPSEPQLQGRGRPTQQHDLQKEEGKGQEEGIQGQESGEEGETRKFDVPSVFAARRAAERWEPCGRWTNFVFIFVNPLSGDGSGAYWVARADANGHYQTAFKDICTRVHIYNLRHGEGGAPAGFQLLRRVAAAKHVLSVAAAEEAKHLTWKSSVPPATGAAAATAPGRNAAGAGHAAGGSGTVAGGKAGVGEYRHGSQRPHALVRAIAVGGDGTVSWVNRAASEAGIEPNWLAIGVVGFGTGNDFAQSYGWGNIDYSANIFKGDVLKQYVKQWQSAQVAPHDVWRITVKTTPNGYFEHIDSTTRTFKKILRETTGRPSTVLSGYMTLYFGIGFEALLGLTFDMSRSTSRLRNRILYGLAFFKHFNKPWRLATEQIESVYVFEDNQKKVLFTTNPVKYSLSFRLQPAISLTFIGTETILGGVKVWAHSRRVGVAPPLTDSSRLRRKYETFIRRLSRVKQDMGDKKLELIAFRDRFSLMRSVMYEQNAASRLMQHRGPFYAKFYSAKVSGPVPFQVDGEFFLGHNVVGAEVKYEKTFYVLKQAERRTSMFKVSNIIEALGVGERGAAEIEQ